METLNLKIEGMSCGHCVARVTRALTSVPGVVVERVDVGSAAVQFDPDATSLLRIREAIDAVGFDATPVVQPA